MAELFGGTDYSKDTEEKRLFTDLFKATEPEPQAPLASQLPNRLSKNTDEDDVPPLLRLLGIGGAAQAPESFEDYLKARQTPAQSALDAFRVGFMTSRTGQAVKTQREQLFDEFKQKEQTEIQKEQIRSRLKEAAATIIQREQSDIKQRETQRAIAELNHTDNLEDRKQKADQFSSRLGFDIEKEMRDQKDSDRKFAAQQEELPDQMHETFRKIVERENPGLSTKDPKKFFDKVEAKVNQSLINESIAKKIAQPGDERVDDVTAAAVAQQIAEGGPLAQIRMMYKGTDAVQKANNLLLKNHTIVKDKAFNIEMRNLEGGISTLNQISDLTIEARKIMEERGGLAGLTANSEGLVGRFNGWLVELNGKIGEDAVANVLKAFVDGPVARRMAKAAGEGSRISDQDAQAFVRSLPNVTNTPGEADRLTRENKKVVYAQMKNLLQNQYQPGGPNKNPKALSLSQERFEKMYGAYRKDNPGSTMADFMQRMIELGHNLSF